MLKREINALSEMRLYIEFKLSALVTNAVNKIRPFNLKASICKAIIVIKFICIVAQSLCSYGAIAIFHLQCARMRRSVGEKQAVNAEITVVLCFTVVAAVGVLIRSVFVINGMVGKFPNTAAEDIIRLKNILNIFLKFTCSESHGVCILAHKIRFCIKLLCQTRSLCNLSHKRMPRIHLGHNIISPAFCSANALIMNRNITATL